MKGHLLIRVVLAVFVLVGAFGMGAQGSSAQDPAQNELLHLLGSVPDNENTRTWLSFGDMEAWYNAWGVPRLPGLAVLDFVAAGPRALWMYVMPEQTQPPEVLGIQYLMLDEMRPFYGFDLFNADRWVYAGGPPDDVTFLRHNANPEAVAAQLVASGYTAEELDGGWTLFSILDDYQSMLRPPADGPAIPRAGMIGQMNRIALNGQDLIIARATANVTAVLETIAGDAPALAADPAYAALGAALDDPALAANGPLIGAILQPGSAYWATVTGEAGLARLNEDERQRVREAFGLDDPARLLPPYDLVGFITSRDAAGTLLTLVLVFPEGMDQQVDLPAHAAMLGEKMATYKSFVAPRGRDLSEYWSLERAGTLTAGGRPVITVVMRAAERESDGRISVLDWSHMVYRRDVAFLAAKGIE